MFIVALLTSSPAPVGYVGQWETAPGINSKFLPVKPKYQAHTFNCREEANKVGAKVAGLDFSWAVLTVSN